MAWLLLIYVLEAPVPRVTPPGGFVDTDFFFMLLIPAGALHIAYWCSNRWVLLLFGGVAAMLFVPGYLANGRLGLSIGYGRMTVTSILWGWVAFVASSMLVCVLVGETYWRWASITGWFDIQQRRRKLGLCEKCGYDLRASKVRCPECGTAIESANG